jgi:hypothetical protein
MRIETRAVLAGAYRENNPKSFLTHAVEVSDAGRTERVLCSRVKLDSMCDLYGLPESEHYARPTCPVCAKRWDKARRA